MAKEKKYTITNLSAKQLRMIQKSLDFYARMGLLQYERVPIDELTWGSKFSGSYRKNRDEIEFLLQKVKMLMVSENEDFKGYGIGHWSLGIAGPDTPKPCQSCYEMSSLIQDLFAKEGGGHIKGKLDLTGDEDIIVRETDMRAEKLIKLLNKTKK